MLEMLPKLDNNSAIPFKYNHKVVICDIIPGILSHHDLILCNSLPIEVGETSYTFPSKFNSGKAENFSGISVLVTLCHKYYFASYNFHSTNS